MSTEVDVPATRIAWRIVVRGVVQGVGFRPFVHRLAEQLDVTGEVGNDSGCVFVVAHAPRPVLDELVRRLRDDAPPLARVESIEVDPSPTEHGTPPVGFRIVESARTGGARTLVPPDVATCDECLAEVCDPADRRYRHPFANCTNCGPRFTVIRDLPYDRPATTMAGFEMCSACLAEYGDPRDRRYHAQPIACPQCGPQLAWERDGRVVRGTDAVLTELQRALAAGAVVAVKGIGGYHLAVDASNAAALARLRERKGRVDKPFAVMVPDLAAARLLATIDDVEVDALASPARPIVLLRRRADAPLASGVAPGNPWIGVMLPYTPLHHLLFAPVPGVDVPVPSTIVLTSGNLGDEPICTDDDEARMRLAALADAFVTHDRPIAVPCDDSVVRVIDGVVQPVRRSRGYAPLPLTLPIDVMPVLAVGGELKNTCCVASGRHAWVGQHVGDMANLDTLAAFERTVRSFETMYAIEPQVLAADRHPGYLTRRWALDEAARTPGQRVVDVQHHHAHVAAVMAEHGLDGTSPVIGMAFDGTGYATAADGTARIWGGEVLVADYASARRVGHLRELPLPGGDHGVRNPCRIALAYLVALGIAADDDLPAVAACDATERRVVARQAVSGVGCVPTSSMGRLFDAVSSLVGVRHRISYEAQAAIELEALAETGDETRHPLAFEIDDDGVFDPGPVLEGIVAGMRAGVHAADLAAAFHSAVAAAIVASALRVRATDGLDTVALSGGTFQNTVLARASRLGLERSGFRVLAHRLVPPNDGGLSLGQAVVAGHIRTTTTIGAAASNRRG